MLTSEIRGQTMLYDLMFAVMIFLLLFAFAISKYASIMNDLSRDDAGKEMRNKAEIIAGSLAEGKGVPENWHVLSADDINQIGLARKPMVVSQERLEKFVSMDYNETKDILGIAGYEFFFGLSDMNFGIAPSGAAEAIKIERPVEYEGNISLMEFTLWVKSG